MLASVSCLVLMLGCNRSNSDSAAGAASSAPGGSSAALLPATDSLVGPPPNVDITAVEVVDALDKDKKAAIGRYKGKNALVYGPMGEVGKDDKRGAFVTFPKNPDDPMPDAPRLRCFLKAGEEAALASRKRGDKIDAMGTFEEADGELYLKNCVVDTQMKVCNLINKSLGRGGCESNGDKLGVRWKSTTDSVEIVCQSPGGFEAWSKEWAAVPKDQQMKTKASLDKTACHAVLESVNIKLVVDLTVALGRIRWVNNAPALAP
jgi:tRNA_anti-like